MQYKRYFLAFFGLVAVLILFFAFSSEKEIIIKNHPSSGENIIFFGDSLVQGVGASEGRDLPALLSEKLGVSVINAGKSGDTSITLLQRIDEVTKNSPKIVIVLIGGNDIIRRVPISETEKNIGMIIEKIQEAGGEVVLVGIEGIFNGSTYKKMYSSISKKYQTVYIPDILEGVFGNKELMSDEIHPNDKGYEIVLERVYGVVKNLLD